MRSARATPRPVAATLALAAALASALGLGAACNTPPELQLAIRLPAGSGLFEGVARLDLSASRNGVTLAQASFPASATSVALAGVSHGASTVVRLDGMDGNGNVAARGLTCPASFEGPLTAPLYFAPINFFAATASPPLVERQRPLAYTVTSELPGFLAVGDVLLLGGASSNGTVVATSERFVPGTATFSAHPTALAYPRWKAEAALLSGVGLLITGGVDAAGQVLSAGEILRSGTSGLDTLDTGFDARVGHRLVALSSGAAFLSGGSHTDGGAPLTSTQTIFVGAASAGYLVKAGPDLTEARREHAAVAAGSAVVVFGGYGIDGAPIASIESLDPLSTDEILPHRTSMLTTARAEATASLLSDGSILVVGGVGVDGPLATAELWNPYTQSTTTFTMVGPRVGHSATVISGDRVLVAGGTDATGAPVATVELFSAATDGFVSERSLRVARTHHLAHSLCDTTVLMSGGSSGVSAELYTPTPAN